MRARVRQRPVGQGGLCEGTLSDRGPVLFRWVFDCGSNQSEPLYREMGRIDGDIDLLFLSHLDADHVNGADVLLANRPTTEVVLPYLNDDERVLLVAAAASAGRISGALLDFATDPSGWLLSRGVSRVTFIRGGDDGESEGSEFSPEDPSPKPHLESERGPWQWGWTVMPDQVERAQIRVIPAGAAMVVHSADVSQIWTLLPQAHRPGPHLLLAFASEIAAQFGQLTPAAAAQQARTSAGQEKLVACYERIWSDHNLISMSLYAGPHYTDLDNWRGEIFIPERRRRAMLGLRSVGWISTGDAKLSTKARRIAFQRHFDRYLPSTSVLVVPHHGAATSWHDDVLKPFADLRVAIAAVGANGYGHPNQIVIDAVENHPAAFAAVTEQALTGLILDARR